MKDHPHLQMNWITIHNRIKALKKGLEVGQKTEEDPEVDQGIEDDVRGQGIDGDDQGREIEEADGEVGLEIEEAEAGIGLDVIEEVGLLVGKVQKRQRAQKHSVKVLCL